MPDLDPECARDSMNSEGRAVIHYRHRLSDGARAQGVEQFRNERLELFELNQHCIIRDLCGRQVDRVAGFQQQPGLSLVIALLNDGHAVIKPQQRLTLKTRASSGCDSEVHRLKSVPLKSVRLCHERSDPFRSYLSRSTCRARRRTLRAPSTYLWRVARHNCANRGNTARAGN